MAEDTPSDAGAPSVAPTVASVLGIKGHLRFRAHGSSQKAHVVLRRVELDDSEDEGEDKPAFYFSLFAQKRIEVKPGKEILLTVADGPFKDQAIMFEGDIPGAASGSDEEETQVAEDEENFAAQEQSMPPKMRKPWVKRTEEPAIASSPILATPIHHSVGVQAQPESACSSTQTTFDLEREIRVREPLQTDVDDNMTDKSTPMELSPIHSVQELAPVETVAPTLTIRLAETEQQSERERSLSPMELDSPPSSPPQSPVRTPADLPPAPSQTKPDASPAEIAKSPVQINGFSTLPPPVVAEPPFVPSSPMHPISDFTNEVARELSGIDIPGFGRSMMDTSLAGAPAKPPPRAMHEARKPSSPPLPKASDLTSGSPKPTPEATRAPVVSRPDEATTPAHPSIYPTVPLARPPLASATAAPKPVRRKIPNPFVSGGFMTDFVGLSSASTSKPSTPLADGSPGPAFTSATGTSATPVDRASPASTSPIAPTADVVPVPVSSISSHAPSAPPPVPPTVAPASVPPAPALAASVSTTVPDFTSPAFTESLRSALSALASAQATPIQETTPEVSAPQVQSDVKREPSPLTISPSIRRAASPSDEIPGLSGMFDSFPKPRARPPAAERSPAPLPRVPEPSPVARPLSPPISVRAQAAPVAKPPTPSTPAVQQSRPVPPPFMPPRQFTPSEQPPPVWGGTSRRASMTSMHSASLADVGRPSSASPRVPVPPFVPPPYAASLTPPSLPPPPIPFPPFPPTGLPGLPLPNLPSPHYPPPSMPPPSIPPPKMYPPIRPPPNLSSANAALPTPRPPPPAPPPPPNLSEANAISPSFSRYPNRPAPSFIPPPFPPPSATPPLQSHPAPPMFPPPSAAPSLPPRSIPPPLFPPPSAAPSAPPAPPAPPSMPPYAPDFATYDPSQPFIPGLQGKSTYNVNTSSTPTPSSPSGELQTSEAAWPSPPGLREALANLRMHMASPQRQQQQWQPEQEQETYRQQESYQQQDMYQQREQEPYRQREQEPYQQREQEPYQRRQQEQHQESYHVRQQEGYQYRQQEQYRYEQQEEYRQQEQEQYIPPEQKSYQQQQEPYQQQERYAPPAVLPSQAMPPKALLSRPTSRYSPPTPPPIPYRPSIDTASIVAPQPIPSGSTNVLKRKVSPPVSASTLVGFQPSFDSHRSFQWPALTSNISAQIKGEDVGIRGIVFSATGNYIAVNCHDCTVRVWDNILHTEIARLSHVAPVVSAAWLEDDEGILSLSENGSLGKWTRTPQMPGDQWQWTKIAEPSNAERKPEDVPTAMAYIRDRIAVAFPRVGVKVWMLNKGTWQPQRSILRQNVTAIHFVEDGDALLGGTKDGVLWYCQIPNGTLRAYTFFKSTVYHIDVNRSGSHALVAQTGGRTHIVGIRQDDNKGKIEQVYALKDSDSHPNATYDFGALFTSKDSLILFGTVDGCVLLWDKDKAAISCGLDLGEAAVAQAVGSFTSRSSSSENCLVTGSKDGKLTWWPQPSISDIEEFSHKRMKTGAS